ncbi:MAG TPA: hypothetical protein DCP40_03900 [Stenotrophomonas sp.]|nr:hypothetical protein [Stenotrophomonas sp.]
MSHTLNDLLHAMQQGDESPQIFASLLSAWIEHTASELGDVLSRHGAADPLQQQLIDQILADYRALDALSRTRLMLSTEVSSYLEEPEGKAFDGAHVGTGTLLQGIADALQRERSIAMVRAGQAPLCDDEGIDSPLGDVIAVRNAGHWQLRQRPQIADVITLDIDSRLSLRHEPDSGTFCRERLEVDVAEEQIILDKLEKAMALIDEATPMFGLMIKTFTRRILVRKSVELSDVVDRVPLGSEYRPIHTGCIRILNVHRPEMTVALCAEAILHESTHSFLSAYESIHGKFMSSEIRYRPVSPWSGNYIPNHSLAHAIFVYYALHELFDRAIGDDVTMDSSTLASIRRRRLDVAVGFCVDRSLSSMFFLETDAVTGFLPIVDRMQADIASRYMTGTAQQRRAAA